MSLFNEVLLVIDAEETTRIGALLSQLLLTSDNADIVSEHTIFSSLVLMQSFTALVIQLLGIGSAALFFISAFPLFIALLLNPLLLSLEGGRGAGARKEIALSTYALGQVLPLYGGVLLLVPIVEVFVPLVRPHFPFLEILVANSTLLSADRPYRCRRSCRQYYCFYRVCYWCSRPPSRYPVCTPLWAQDA